MSLNTVTDQYRCNLCGVSGNSVSLYARVHNMSNKEAYLELAKNGKVYPMPSQPVPQTQERKPRALEERHAVYSEMLSFLSLSGEHRENLLERGSERGNRIEQNGYRSMPGDTGTAQASGKTGRQQL